MNNLEETAEVTDARREVAARRAALKSDLRSVEQSSERIVAQIGAKAKPVLIAGAVVIGVVIVGKLLSRTFGKRSRRNYFFEPQPSIASALVRSAAVLVARGLARKLAGVAVAKLGAAAAQSLEAPAPGVQAPASAASAAV